MSNTSGILMYFVIHDSAGRLREGRCFHNVWVHPQSIAWSVCVLGLRKGSSRRSAAGILDFDISRSKTVLRNMCVDESFWPPIPISAELSATISTARLLKRNEFAFYLNADSNNPQPWFHTSNSVNGIFTLFKLVSLIKSLYLRKKSNHSMWPYISLLLS